MSAGASGAGSQDQERSVELALDEIVAQSPVIVCCGPGGVGKTTISSVLALQAARIGRRACVVTVDPARRLADSLGIDVLDNSATIVDGDWPGQLSALMLDTKRTFDDLVERYSLSADQAETIRGNRLYQNLVGALSGTQEYMAMEKLYELTESSDYDLVVVDTPPTRNALDLLDAPRRLTHFLENRLFRALLVPTRAYLKAVGFATQAVLRTIAKVAGAEIVQDAVAFFQAFEGMEEGFHARAAAVRSLLADPSTSYVVVTSPRIDAVDEASFFLDKLVGTGVVASGLIVNRVHPRFAGADVTMPQAPQGSDLAQIVENFERLRIVHEQEEQIFADLAEQVSAASIGRVALLASDVHDLAGLTSVADQLFDDFKRARAF